jgi:hypothetical protein
MALVVEKARAGHSTADHPNRRCQDTLDFLPTLVEPDPSRRGALGRPASPTAALSARLVLITARISRRGRNRMRRCLVHGGARRRTPASRATRPQCSQCGVFRYVSVRSLDGASRGAATASCLADGKYDPLSGTFAVARRRKRCVRRDGRSGHWVAPKSPGRPGSRSRQVETSLQSRLRP